MSEWMESAVCRQLDPELFFDPGMVEEAVKVCREYCPVLAECREWAIRGNLEFGVVGGMSAPERRAAASAAASAAGVPLPVVEPEHGTAAGAKRHRQAGERPCGLCRDAENAAHRERRARMAREGATR